MPDGGVVTRQISDVMGKKQYAYALLNVKDVTDNPDYYEISGIASTPTLDRQGDVVEPMGAQFSLPMPLLLYHDSEKPVGYLTFAKATKAGIPYTARIPKVLEAGTLKDRIDEAVQSIKHRLIAAVSIGFKPVDGEVEATKTGYRFLKWLWLELSLVVIPAQADATITSIKSLDQQQRAASGHTPPRPKDSIPPPGATGTPTKPAKQPVFFRPEQQGKSQMRTYTEQIASAEAKRAANVARMGALMDNDEGRTLNETEVQEYDGLDTEVKDIDTHLVRLKNQARLMASTAVAVGSEAGSDPVTGSNARQGVSTILAKSNLMPAAAFTRYAIALCRAKGNLPQALEISKQWHDSTPEVETVLKAAVTTGNTTDATWAQPLALPNTMASEFVEFLRPLELLGKIQGLRRVPFNVRFPRATAGSTSGWVGQAQPKPVSRMSFETMIMAFSKVATIVVLTDELVRFSNPSAEQLVRDDMARAIVLFTDQQFIDPSVAAVPGVSPASITNGVTELTSSGTTIAQITADVAALWRVLLTGNIMPAAPVFIMNPRTALFLSLVRTTQDIIAFPGLSMMGGTFFGIPVVTSNAVPIETDGTCSIVFLDASQIFLADDGGVTLDVSMEASLQMDSVPTGGAAQLVSMFQNNMLALRAERYINWQRRREAAVAVLSQITY